MAQIMDRRLLRLGGRYQIEKDSSYDRKVLNGPDSLGIGISERQLSPTPIPLLQWDPALVSGTRTSPAIYNHADSTRARSDGLIDYLTGFLGNENASRADDDFWSEW